MISNATSDLCDTSSMTNVNIRNTFSIMSFNIRFGTAQDGINHWKNRRELLLKVIKETSPDILCLQEAMKFQESYILQNAGRPYTAIGIPRNGGKGGQDDESTTILIDTTCFKVESHETYWLSETPLVAGSTSYGNDLPRTATQVTLAHAGSGQRFVVVNTHLDHASQRARREGVKQIVSHVSSSGSPSQERVLIVGDMNNESNDAPEIKYLQQKGFIDTHFELHGVMPATFHDFTGDAEKVYPPKIDFIWRKGPFRTISSTIVRSNDPRTQRYPSDHFPILAKLSLI